MTEVPFISWFLPCSVSVCGQHVTFIVTVFVSWPSKLSLYSSGILWYLLIKLADLSLSLFFGFFQ